MLNHNVRSINGFSIEWIAYLMDIYLVWNNIKWYQIYSHIFKDSSLTLNHGELWKLVRLNCIFGPLAFPNWDFGPLILTNLRFCPLSQHTCDKWLTCHISMSCGQRLTCHISICGKACWHVMGVIFRARWLDQNQRRTIILQKRLKLVDQKRKFMKVKRSKSQVCKI
jgi:hypothetical protein